MLSMPAAHRCCAGAHMPARRQHLYDANSKGQVRVPGKRSVRQVSPRVDCMLQKHPRNQIKFLIPDAALTPAFLRRLSDFSVVDAAGEVQRLSGAGDAGSEQLYLAGVPCLARVHQECCCIEQL